MAKKRFSSPIGVSLISIEIEVVDSETGEIIFSSPIGVSLISMELVPNVNGWWIDFRPLSGSL